MTQIIAQTPNTATIANFQVWYDFISNGLDQIPDCGDSLQALDDDEKPDLTRDQYEKLAEISHDLQTILDSDEHNELQNNPTSDYNPDLNLADALQAVNELLDYCDHLQGVTHETV